MNLPKVSIVTPSYMQGHFIEWTIRSVLQQNYPNLEYIVMDGGSKDETVPILERYADQFAYFESKKDKGQADAICRGFERTTGEIMAYLNSDDMLTAGTLHRVAKYFDEHPEVDVIYSHRCFVDERNRVLGYWILPPHSSYLMKRFDYIPQETTFWRRRIFDKVGNIDPTFRFAMDYDLFARFMIEGNMRRVHDIYGAFRIHDTSKTQTQIQTIGMQEMDRVRTRYNIKIRKPDILLLKAFIAYVKLGSFGRTQYLKWKHKDDPSLYLDFGRMWNGEIESPVGSELGLLNGQLDQLEAAA
ncbi:glycosyltransferase [bacterium]|nr:glycosyltransferase [bacterium]